jgi:hypothetical protein
MRFDKSNLVPNLVSVSVEKSDGKDVLKVIKDSVVKDADEPTFVKIKNSNLENGIIEVKVLSRLTKTAPAFARGFIGVAFRINEQNNKFEAIYLRPTITCDQLMVEPTTNSDAIILFNISPILTISLTGLEKRLMVFMKLMPTWVLMSGYLCGLK